jgi:hypothetical protein
MKIKHIDRRMNGYTTFKYYVSFTKIQEFCDIRK